MGSPALTEAQSNRGWWIALIIAALLGVGLHMAADAIDAAGRHGIAGLLRAFVAPGAMFIGWELRGLFLYLAALDKETGR